MTWRRNRPVRSESVTILEMSDESVGETKSEPMPPKRRGNPLMRAGAPSLNPHGRPKRGESIAELYRRCTDWEAVRARLEKIVTSPKTRDADAVAAARELCDRAWGRPLSSHELTVRQGEQDDERSFAHLSESRMRELLAELDGEEPKTSDLALSVGEQR